MSSLIAMQLAETDPVRDAAIATHPPERNPCAVWLRLVAGNRTRRACAVMVAAVIFGGFGWFAQTVVSYRVQENDANTLVQAATDEHQRIESLSGDDKAVAIESLCKTVGSSIAGLEQHHPEKTKQLRRILIERLLQRAPQRFQEAERQIVLLDAAPDDGQVVKWLALALVGQVDSAIYRQRDPWEYERESNYWRWLSHQPPGDVLFAALDHDRLNVRLLAHLVELAQHQPELFSDGPSTRHALQQRRSLQQRVQDRVALLREINSSHSLLIRHRFESSRDPAKAAAILARGAEGAEKRLLEKSGNSVDGVRNSDAQSMTRLSAVQPLHFWDFALLMLVAQNHQQTNPKLAQRYYGCLMGQRVDNFPAAAIERVHLLSGQLAREQNQPAQAMQIWQAGIERISPHSLELMGAIAGLATDDKNKFGVRRGTSILRRYRHVIEVNAALVANAPPDQFTLALRKQMGRKIRAARWRAAVLESQLLSRDRAKGEAIECLRLALTQAADIPAVEEQQACVRLAGWYLAEGAADLAAAFFERAHRLRPDDDWLRQQTANAWMLAGNRSRATSQKRRLHANATLEMKLAGVEARFQQVLAERLGQQLIQSVRTEAVALIREIQRRRVNLNHVQDLRNVCSRLEIVQACLPVAGVPLERHLNSVQFQEDVARIATEYQDEKSVQCFAAEYMAAIGSMAQSNRAIQALKRCGDATEIDVAVTRARVLAASDQPVLAAKRLLGEVEQLKPRSREIHTLAAKFAYEAGDLVLAYEALSVIVASQRTCHDLFTLAKLAGSLPADCEVFARNDITPVALMARWKTELQKREHGACGFHHALEAHTILQRLSARTESIAFDDPQLGKAKRIVRDLISLRPCWPETTLLAAELAVLEGNSGQAIQMLRDAVLAGSEALSLRQSLEQLRAASRSTPHHWAHFASSRRTIETPASHSPSPSTIGHLLVAHQAMTAAGSRISSNCFSIAYLLKPKHF